MSKVELTKNGRAVKVDSRLAKHLLSRQIFGYARRDLVADDSKSGYNTKDEDEVLASLRAKYQKVVGKKAYHGWSAEELNQKIADAG